MFNLKHFQVSMITHAQIYVLMVDKIQMDFNDSSAIHIKIS